MLPQNRREIPLEFRMQNQTLKDNKTSSAFSDSQPEIYAQGKPCLVEKDVEKQPKKQQNSIAPILAALIIMDMLS